MQNTVLETPNLFYSLKSKKKDRTFLTINEMTKFAHS